LGAAAVTNASGSKEKNTGCMAMPGIFFHLYQFFFRKYTIFAIALGRVQSFIGSSGNRGDGIALLETADTYADRHRQGRTIRRIIQVIARRGNRFTNVLGSFTGVFQRGPG
jgi:hypothetical protein